MDVLGKKIRKINQVPDISISFFDKTIEKPNNGTKIPVRGSILSIKDEMGNTDGLAVVFKNF